MYSVPPTAVWREGSGLASKAAGQRERETGIHIYFSGKRASQMPRIASPLPCWCPLRFITSLFIDITDGTFCWALENHPPSPRHCLLFAALQRPLTLHFASATADITGTTALLLHRALALVNYWTSNVTTMSRLCTER